MSGRISPALFIAKCGEHPAASQAIGDGTHWGFKILFFYKQYKLHSSCLMNAFPHSGSILHSEFSAVAQTQAGHVTHHVPWSLDPGIELSARLSACGSVLRPARSWDWASLGWRRGLCHWLPASDTAEDERARSSTRKLLLSEQTWGFSAGVVGPTWGSSASSWGWWVSFLWRTSECFSRWEWGTQLTVSRMDSAAAKRLDSAETHWPRESRKRTMAVHEERRPSAASHGPVWRETATPGGTHKGKHANGSRKRQQR